MRKMPHSLRLAQIDDRHFITACRYGLVHLTWGRITARFSRDEFGRLANLLERLEEAGPPASLRDGELQVTSRIDDDCELCIGPLALLMTPARLQQLAGAASEAVQRLEDLLASGLWDRDEEEDTPPGGLGESGRIPFSQN